jgi:hypothetical protein
LGVRFCRGNSTHTVITYNGDRLPSDKIAKVELPDNFSEMGPFDSRWNFNVDVLAVDNIEMNIDGSAWSKNYGPAAIELLPGNHSLILKQFLRSGKEIVKVDALGTWINADRRLLRKGPVTLNAEAGHIYALTFMNGKQFRFINDPVLRYIIEDKTENGKVVSSNIPKQELQFSLQNIPKDKAVVCFFRERRARSCLGDFVILENDQDIGILPNGNFFYLDAVPGMHKYSIKMSGTGSSIDVNLTPGSITYISPIMNFFDFDISLVPETDALTKISILKPVPPTGIPDQNRCL